MNENKFKAQFIAVYMANAYIMQPMGDDESKEDLAKRAHSAACDAWSAITREHCYGEIPDGVFAFK